MRRQTFKTIVKAPRKRVWKVLWGRDTYPVWTSAFAEGSNVETDWKKGSKARFFDGQGRGMLAMIAENIPNELMSFKHIGMLKNGVEDTESHEVKEWAGAMENYTLQPIGEDTELIVEMDIEEKYLEYFTTTWPKALEKVKTLAET